MQQYHNTPFGNLKLLCSLQFIFLAADNCGFHHTVHEIKTSLHLSVQVSSPFFLPPSPKELYVEQWNICIKTSLPSYLPSGDFITNAMKNSIIIFIHKCMWPTHQVKNKTAYVEGGRNHVSVKDAYMTIVSTHTQYLHN